MTGAPNFGLADMAARVDVDVDGKALELDDLLRSSARGGAVEARPRRPDVMATGHEIGDRLVVERFAVTGQLRRRFMIPVSVIR
jgi:hypothetical protein